MLTYTTRFPNLLRATFSCTILTDRVISIVCENSSSIFIVPLSLYLTRVYKYVYANDKTKVKRKKPWAKLQIKQNSKTPMRIKKRTVTKPPKPPNIWANHQSIAICQYIYTFACLYCTVLCRRTLTNNQNRNKTKREKSKCEWSPGANTYIMRTMQNPQRCNQCSDKQVTPKRARKRRANVHPPAWNVCVLFGLRFF